MTSAANQPLSKDAPLYNQIQTLTEELLQYGCSGVEKSAGWSVFAQDGPMKLYRKEVVIDGHVIDPLKAVHTVNGVTACEYCHYFFGHEYKMEWDFTLVKVNLVEKVASDTLVIFQVHTKMFPTAQRETLFWSHFRQADSFKDGDALDLFCVVNHDLQRKDVPVGKHNLRVGLRVAMICQTVLAPGTTTATAKRTDLTCRVIYVSELHPGGWAPQVLLRQVYKREYPKFLKKFTKYVQDATAKKPIMYTPENK